MKLRAMLVGLVLLSGAGRAFAQTPAPGGNTTVPTKKPQQQTKLPPEIKHGVYAEFNFGVLAYLGGDAAKNNNAGVMAGFAVGADVGKYLRIEGRMLNATNDSSGTYVKTNITGADPLVQQYPCPTDPTTACAQAPDAEASIVSADVKAVLPMNDRLNFHALGGVGVLLSNPGPDQLFKFDADAQLQKPDSVSSGSTPVFAIGGGLEYYTHLRHFSVGADAAAWVVPGPGGLMFTLFPTIKYTF
jgi:hypothetical protein